MIVEVSHISKKIGKSILLDDISLSLKKGEVFGFLGHNGAGKTTTMKSILGVVKIDGGSITILGGKIEDPKIRKRIGFMPENTYLYKHLTGDEFLDWSGSFYWLSKEKLEQRKNELFSKMGLSQARKKRLGTYSKWMLQRIGLAQAILHDPELIFLDEPMSGLDPIWRKMVKDLLLELKWAGKTLFFNTHILSDVEAICDTYAIIARGKIVIQWKIKELSKPLETIFMESMEDISMLSEYTK
jgi:ABC-2 type transport system ATP-binding protein